MSDSDLQSEADEFARREGMSEDDLTLVEKFKSKVANFLQRYDNLQTQQIDARKYPDIARQRTELLSRGRVLHVTIKTVSTMIDKVMRLFGGSGLNGLAVVPLLPIAAISIAVAAITKWGTDAYEFTRRLDAIKDLEAKGYDPVRAGQIVNQQFPPTSFNFGSISTLLPWLAVAGIIFYAVKSGKLK